MEPNPVVRITKLDRKPDGSVGPQASLGNFKLDLLNSMLLEKLAARARAFFLLEWEGSKIPRGAVIAGHTIAWTQNGQVLTESGEFIAVYARLSEFGGTSRREQKMVVFLLSHA